MERWIALWRDFPASRGAPPESRPEKTTSAGYGLTSLAQFQKLNRHCAGSRTCPDLFLGVDSNPSLLTLPGSGSMRSGVICQQAPLALPMSASASSSWPTATAQDSESSGGSAYPKGRNTTLTDAAQREWPTPNVPNGGRTSIAPNWASPKAEDAESAGMRHARGVADTLTAQTALWQTPSSENFRSRGGDRKDEPGLDRQETRWPTPDALRGGPETEESKAARATGGGTAPNLQAAAKNWPTPDASLLNDGQTEEARAKRKARELLKNYNGNGGGEPLAYVARTWPTPAARDVKGDYSDEAMTRKDGKTRDDLLPNVASRFSPPGQRTSDGPASSSEIPRERLRLNPAFVCWLMGWPLFWTQLEPISCGSAATASWRSKLRRRLSCLLGGR